MFCKMTCGKEGFFMSTDSPSVSIPSSGSSADNSEAVYIKDANNLMTIDYSLFKSEHDSNIIPYLRNVINLYIAAVKEVELFTEMTDRINNGAGTFLDLVIVLNVGREHMVNKARFYRFLLAVIAFALVVQSELFPFTVLYNLYRSISSGLPLSTADYVTLQTFVDKLDHDARIMFSKMLH